MTSAEPHPDGERLDLRIAPAALTAWAVTAAGILWHIGGSLAAAAVATGLVAAAARSGGARRGGAAVLAVAVVGAAFAVAVGLRVDQVRDHPIVQRYGAGAEVEVTPTETPRVLKGARLMFRADLTALDGRPSRGRVLVFARAAGYGAVTVGRPTRFRATVARPLRRDLTVAVLSATGQPTVGQAPAVQRAAQHVRVGFADAARGALPADQAAMLPALVLGDTATVTGQTTEQFRAAGLTHASV